MRVFTPAAVSLARQLARAQRLSSHWTWWHLIWTDHNFNIPQGHYSSHSSIANSLTVPHSLTHSLTHSLIHSLSHSLSPSITHLLTHSPTHVTHVTHVTSLTRSVYQSRYSLTHHSIKFVLMSIFRIAGGSFRFLDTLFCACRR